MFQVDVFVVCPPNKCLGSVDDDSIRLFCGIFTSTRALSPTWNFPDTVIQKALMRLFKREDYRNLGFQVLLEYCIL